MTDRAGATDLTSEMLEALEGNLQRSIIIQDAGIYAQLSEMISYHFGWSGDIPLARGKRLRPLLTMLCCASAGGRWQDALPAASAVELIHNFSLVHDDIQDNSHERRGRPTLWARWGVAQAINAGDALLVLARLSNSRLVDSGISASKALAVQRLLDEACLLLTKGQYLDLTFQGKDSIHEIDYLEMIEGKTAALISAATACGARLADAPHGILDAYRRFGSHLGLAFQILDDILGIWGTPEVTGKPAVDDLVSHKKTLPIVYGLDHSEEFVNLWSSRQTDERTTTTMVTALEKAGALDYARLAAERHTDQALADLEQAEPKGEAGAELGRLSRRLLKRDR